MEYPNYNREGGVRGGGVRGGGVRGGGMRGGGVRGGNVPDHNYHRLSLTSHQIEELQLTFLSLFLVSSRSRIKLLFSAPLSFCAKIHQHH